MGQPPTFGRHVTTLSAVVTVLLALVACGRSGSVPTGLPDVKAGASTGSTPTGAGDFGDLKKICGPGNASGGNERGVSAREIRIGVTADPGAVAAPGLEREFFEVADAFTKWCNAAGGINGRRIVLDKYDAKLFEVAAQVINACQKDFMLVGNGNAFDAAGVKPRLECELAQIPAYSVSPQAVSAGLQVQATPNPPDQYQVGPFRLLGEKFPSAMKNGIAIAGSTVATIAPQSLRARDALRAIGYRVPILQQRQPLIDNFRPYMEQIKASGASAYTEIGAQDMSPEFQAISNVGLSLDYVGLGTQFYDSKTIGAAKSSPLPPTWVFFSHLPFELDATNPVVRQVKDIMKAGVADPQFNEFVALAFNAWTLWAKSATACGNDLSKDCVLENAAGERAWTAGGFFSPRDTDPGNPQQPTCYVLMKVTPDGFVYDKDVTQPNTGVYNCDAKNVVALKQTYQ